MCRDYFGKVDAYGNLQLPDRLRRGPAKCDCRISAAATFCGIADRSNLHVGHLTWRLRLSFLIGRNHSALLSLRVYSSLASSLGVNAVPYDQ